MEKMHLVNIKHNSERPMYVQPETVRFIEPIKHANPEVDEAQCIVLLSGSPGDWKIETKLLLPELLGRFKTVGLNHFPQVK